MNIIPPEEPFLVGLILSGFSFRYTIEISTLKVLYWSLFGQMQPAMASFPEYSRFIPLMIFSNFTLSAVNWPGKKLRIMTSSGYSEFRRYDPSDKTEVIALFRLNTPAFFAPEEEKELIVYLDQFSQHYFIIEWGSKIIGCGGINLSEDLTAARISWDFLHPDHQGKGLGSALLQFRIERIKEYKTMRTITVRTSQMAYLFYQKAGFVLKQTIRDYWAPGFDLYRMEYKVSETASSG